MIRVSSRARIFIALSLSYLVVQFSPKLLVSSPYIPTREELLHLVTLPSIKWNINLKMEGKTVTPTPEMEVIIVPTTDPFENIPTEIPVPTEGSELPTLVPTQAIYPTSPVVPSAIPTTVKPTTKPSPTAVPNKVPNYSTINGYVSNPPQIGCKNNTISGCPYETLYQTPVDKGLGWATFYADEHKSGYNLVADVIHNNKRITMEAAVKFINDNFMEKQSHMTPEEAKKTGKVIAYAATRSPKDLWKIKYMFGIDDPKNPKAHFIGRVMIVDCAAPNDWKTNLAIYSYSYKGWTALNWIIDLSKNGFIQLPTGISGQQSNTGDGRPGVILIDEGSLDNLIY